MSARRSRVETRRPPGARAKAETRCGPPAGPETGRAALAGPVLENALISRLVGGLPRSPHQLNRTQESDAEIVQLPGLPGFLVLEVDAVVEELASGLYADPYLAGWMTVTASASDLAAVGAEPLGLLLSQTLPQDAGEEWVGELQRGIGDACRIYELPVLGGDTSVSDRPQMAGFALGRVSEGQPMTRLGTTPGDVLFASGPLGLGNAFAFQQLVGSAADGGSVLDYRPRARLAEGRLLRGTATACMDTSDGALAALDQLARLNGVGFVVDRPHSAYLNRGARRLAESAGLPPCSLLAGQHGEFELLFTLRPEDVEAFRERARHVGWRPVPLGAAVREPGTRIATGRGLTPVDTLAVRNLSVRFAGDAAGYVDALLEALG